MPSCQCIVGAGDDDNDTQNYLVKIEVKPAQVNPRYSHAFQLRALHPIHLIRTAQSIVTFRINSKEFVECYKVARNVKDCCTI